MQYDVIVVGAGPAGSTAAYCLASAGRKVLVLEKEIFPRYKSCAGGISTKARSLITGFQWDKVVESKPQAIVFSYISPRTERHVRVEWEKPLVYMVMRDRFDSLLADRARSAGAEFMFGTPVRGVSEEKNGVVIRTGDGSFRASYVLGADGARSIVGKSLGLMKDRLFGVALSAEVGSDPGDQVRKDEIRVTCGTIKRGFCWVFPKADHYSTGAAVLGSGGKGLNRCLEEFISREGLGRRVICRRGCLLPSDGARKKPITSRRAMLLGDAAGLVDPLTGEGIRYALQSGIFAAQAVIQKDTPSQVTTYYQKKVGEEILPELSAAGKLADLYYPFTGMMLGMLQVNPRLADLVCQAMCGDNSSYSRFIKEELKWLKIFWESLGNYFRGSRVKE